MHKVFSTGQRKLLFSIGFILGTILLVWVVFAPSHSTMEYHRLKNELREAVARNRELAAQNSELQEEIDRLKTDKVYLEKIARERYGLIKKNEIIYQFEAQKEKSKK